MKFDIANLFWVCPKIHDSHAVEVGRLTGIWLEILRPKREEILTDFTFARMTSADLHT